MLKPGDSVDSWCGVCKLISAHSIEAMVAEIPARVRCSTCNAQHRYRSYKPGEGPKAARKSKGGTGRKVRISNYQKLLTGKDMSLARPYSPADRYVLDEVVEHPNFGLGVTTTIKDGDKFEIVFEDGTKTLIHGR